MHGNQERMYKKSGEVYLGRVEKQKLIIKFFRIDIGVTKSLKQSRNITK